MNAYKKETSNEVNLQGKIVYKYSTPKATMLTLSIKNPVTSVKNFPNIVFFGEAKKQADTFNEQEFVKVIAHLQSSKRNPAIKNQITLSIFGDQICGAKSTMETNFNVEGDYFPYKNEFKLAGPAIASRAIAENLHEITIKTEKGGRPSFVKLTKFINNRSDPVVCVRPGDFVYVLGHIQTHKSANVNGTKYFQNYLITELKNHVD